MGEVWSAGPYRRPARATARVAPTFTSVYDEIVQELQHCILNEFLFAGMPGKYAAILFGRSCVLDGR